MPGGFIGKYCVIDLTARTTESVDLPEHFYKKYLSGYGLGAAVIAERQKAGIDPLSTESHLGFCSGLLTGTGASFSGRFMAVGKSPLTGGWGDANAGGFLSREMKRAGYDAVFFTGKAEKPVWIFVDDDQIRFEDASPLWGRDTVETEEYIKGELKEPKVQIAAIGISGEKLSRISGIVTDGGRIAARSGLGAVMGSKNLKAVAFRGTGQVPVADAGKVRAITADYLKEYKKSKASDRLSIRFMNPLSKLLARTGISFPTAPGTARDLYKKYGSPGLTVYSGMTGDSPIKNWAGVGYIDYAFASLEKISGERVIKQQKRKYACQGCPLACGGLVDIKHGRYQGTEGHKPEYETVASFGGLLLQDDLDAILEINEMCNRAGIDTISTGATVAFAIECFENDLINEDTTGGMELGWGKTEEILKLTEMIINRQGFGDVLADGVKEASKKIGPESAQYAMHAGGQELGMHDSRLDPGYAIAYQCEPTPGRHTIMCFELAHLFGVKKKFPSAGRAIQSAKGKIAKDTKLYAAGTMFMQLINTSGMCYTAAFTSDLPLMEYLNAVTGWDLSPDEYLKIGERILSLRKAFNMREGLKAGDSKLPGRPLGQPPLTKGPLKGAAVDIDLLEKEFYKNMGWDLSTGGPTRQKMEELEIESLFL